MSASTSIKGGQVDGLDSSREARHKGYTSSNRGLHAVNVRSTLDADLQAGARSAGAFPGRRWTSKRRRAAERVGSGLASLVHSLHVILNLLIYSRLAEHAPYQQKESAC